MVDYYNLTNEYPMRELSLHILDLVQNSITAGADEISIMVAENIADNLLVIEIKDNGCGMTEKQLQKAGNPFYTTRKTRNVGFGISLFKETAKRCDGKLEIKSESGKGTTVYVELVHDHVNLPPMGNMAETIQILVMGNPEINFIYAHKFNNNTFKFDSREYKSELFSGENINYETLAKIKNEIISGLRQND